MSAELARPRPVPGQRRNRRLPLLIGLTLAAAAFLGVFALGSLNNKSAPAATSTVLVAARNIQAREVFTPDMLAPASLPASAVPPGAVLHAADVKGQTALVAILKGQVVTTNLAGPTTDQALTSTAYLPIPQGFVARAIPTGELQGVAGYIAPGDYLNVMATLNTSLFGDNPGKFVTKLSFTNLHVIRVGPSSTSAKAGQTEGVSSTLTVVMTACDAEMMEWLMSSNVKLTYVLLSYKDYSSPPTAPDASCPTSSPASSVTATQVNARFGFTR